MSFAKQATLAIVGLALGEAVALFGAVSLLLTGDIMPFLAGLLILLVPFLNVHTVQTRNP